MLPTDGETIAEDTAPAIGGPKAPKMVNLSATLGELNANLVSMLRLAAKVEGRLVGIDEADFDGLRGSMQKLVLTQQLYTDRLVVVAGSQGVGKTTLLQQLIGAEFAILAGNAGRGEKRPVVVVEEHPKVLPVPLYEKRTAVAEDAKNSMRIGIQVEKIPAEEFVTLSQQDPFEASEGGFSWPALRHPMSAMRLQQLDESALNFLLLPGFEATESGSHWQELLKHVVACSSKLLIVTTAENLASADSSNLAEDLRRWRGVRPVIAITHTEEKSDAVRDDLVKRTLDVFAGLVSENDVFCTGTKNIEQWHNSLIQAIRRTPNAHSAALKAVKHVLTGPLSRPCTNIRAAVEECLDVHRHREALGIRAWLGAFDVRLAELRQELDSVLEQVVDAYLTWDSFYGQYKIGDGGLIDSAKHQLTSFFTSAGDLQKEFDLRVANAWKHEGFQKLVFIKVSNFFQQNEFKLLNVNKPDELEVQRERFVQENKGAILFALTEMNTTDVNEGLKQDVAGVLAHMTLLTTTLGYQAAVLKMEPASIDLKKYGEMFKDNVEDSLSLQKASLLAFTGGLGLDGLDGTIDTIPAALELFGLGAGAVPYVVGAGTVIAAAYAGISAAKAYARDDYMIGKQAYENLRDSSKKQYLRQFDKTADVVRNRLNKVLQNRYGIAEDVQDLHALHYQCSCVERLNSRMRVEIQNGLLYAG
jgi:hypothetical protein